MTTRFALVSIVSFAGLAALLAGCPQAQTPYSFVARADASQTADASARAMAASGYPVDRVDRQTGIVTSKWMQSGITHADGSVLVRRFTVTVAPSGADASISVRADMQQCPSGGYTAGDMQVMGTCRPVEGVFEKDQNDVNALGARLKSELAGPATQTTSAPAR
jgi:hypothetical protein